MDLKYSLPIFSVSKQNHIEIYITQQNLGFPLDVGDKQYPLRKFKEDIIQQFDEYYKKIILLSGENNLESWQAEETE